MKKKTKIIITIIIVLILLFILGIAIFYLSKKLGIYNITIVEINGKKITAANENLTDRYFFIDEIKIEDENGNEISPLRYTGRR